MIQVTSLPDKWVRKAISDIIDGIVVDGNTIPCFDSQVTRSNPKHYVLMTTQTNNHDDRTKCGHAWRSSILLDIVTRYKRPGNTGSRVLADNISDAIINALESLQLDPASNLTIYDMVQNFEPDLSSETDTENVFRKLLRYEFIIE